MTNDGRTIKSVGYALLAAAAFTSLAFVHVLKPTTVVAMIFVGGWLVLPYALLGFVFLLRATERRTIIADVAVSLVVSTAGLLFLIYIIFLSPDPQGAIAVLLTPVYQLLATAILLPLSRRWVSKN
jgi:hypothetical protein